MQQNQFIKNVESATTNILHKIDLFDGYDPVGTAITFVKSQGFSDEKLRMIGRAIYNKLSGDHLSPHDKKFIDSVGIDNISYLANVFSIASDGIDSTHDKLRLRFNNKSRKPRPKSKPKSQRKSQRKSKPKSQRKSQRKSQSKPKSKSRRKSQRKSKRKSKHKTYKMGRRKYDQLILIGVMAILLLLSRVIIGEISDTLLPYDEQKRFIGAKTESYWDRYHENQAQEAKERAFTPLPFEDPGHPYHLFPCQGKRAHSCRMRRKRKKQLWWDNTADKLRGAGQIGPWGGTDHQRKPF